MGWIASVRCQKFQCEFVARNFALIAPIQPISHQVSCSNETIQNAPKHYKTQQFMSLASNGVDRVRSLRKTLMKKFVARTSSLIALVQPVLHLVSCSNETNPKCTQTVRNGVGRVRLLLKIPMRLNGTNLCINCTSSAQFAPSSVL